MDGFAHDFFICLAALVLTDEGVQEHFPYLLAFAKAIFYLSVGSRENVCFKHAKTTRRHSVHNLLRYFCFAVEAFRPLFGTRGVTHPGPELR
jgi:hypothetical protein